MELYQSREPEVSSSLESWKPQHSTHADLITVDRVLIDDPEIPLQHTGMVQIMY